MFLQQQQPNSLTGVLLLVAIFAIFYFIVIRPTRTQQKKHQAMVKNLKSGDKIVTSGGIYGTIVGIKGDRLQVRIAENVKIEISPNGVAGLQKTGEE